MYEKKKVILINGNKYNWYDQVIFIVKESNQNNIPKNLVLEAEKIINEYMAKKYSVKNISPPESISNINKIDAPKQKSNIKKKTKKNLAFYNNILNISIFFTIVFICYLLYQIYI